MQTCSTFNGFNETIVFTCTDRIMAMLDGSSTEEKKKHPNLLRLTCRVIVRYLRRCGGANRAIHGVRARPCRRYLGWQLQV